MSAERPSKALAPKIRQSTLRTQKPHTVTLVCDLGQEFCSREITDACLNLGVQIAYLRPCQPLAHRPYPKAQVERFFADLNRRLPRSHFSKRQIRRLHPHSRKERS